MATAHEQQQEVQLLFNALKYTEELEKAGFTRSMAETTVKVLMESMDDTFATKSDLRENTLMLRAEMQASTATLRAEMREMNSSLRAEMQEIRSEIREMRSQMTIRFGAIMVVAIGVLATIQKLGY